MPSAASFSLTQPLDQSEKIRHRIELDVPLPKTAARGHYRLQFVVLAKEEAFPDPNLSTRMHQAFPLEGRFRKLPGEKHLHPALEELPCRRVLRTHRLGLSAASAPVQPGRKHPGVVEHNQVVRSQQFGELAKSSIAQLSRHPVQVQQPRSRPIRQRFLGDQLLGKLIMEVGNQHGA